LRQNKFQYDKFTVMLLMIVEHQLSHFTHKMKPIEIQLLCLFIYSYIVNIARLSIYGINFKFNELKYLL